MADTSGYDIYTEPPHSGLGNIYQDWPLLLQVVFLQRNMILYVLLKNGLSLKPGEHNQPFIPVCDQHIYYLWQVGINIQL